MEIQLTSKDKKRIEKSILGKYAKVAISPENLFKYPTGLAGLRALNYDPEIIQTLPESVLASFCGVGNPFMLGQINEGEAVLDIGCGAGVDTIFAAMMVGPTGKAVGVDMTPAMLVRARESIQVMALENVSFEEASAENLPFEEASFDAIISNGVFNLVANKHRALAEAFRILKSNGRFMAADQILVGQLPKDKKSRIKSWFK
jgi:SAM-dependent methyltransferase